MEEEIYHEKYIFVNYLGDQISNTYAGRLQKIIFDKEKGAYQIFFDEFFDMTLEGRYKLIKRKDPVLKTILLENYLGITSEKKETIQKFYDQVNEEIKKLENSKEKNTRNNLYSHGTQIGFLKDEPSDEQPTDSHS